MVNGPCCCCCRCQAPAWAAAAEWEQQRATRWAAIRLLHGLPFTPGLLHSAALIVKCRARQCGSASCQPSCRLSHHQPCLPHLCSFAVQIYSGGSVGGAALINSGEADVVMNWSGGMHHAKKGEASGEGRCRLVF